MANETQVKLVTNGGGYTNPIFITAEITLTDGTGTITAASLGLARILGYAGGVWGATAALGLFLFSSTAVTAGTGVTSMVLEIVNEDGTATTGTATVLFWGTK